MLVYLQSFVAITIGILTTITDFKEKKIYNYNIWSNYKSYNICRIMEANRYRINKKLCNKSWYKHINLISIFLF